MKSFTKILVPTDFSDCSKLALDHALELRRTFGGSITVLHVYTLPVMYPMSPGLTVATIKDTERAAQAALDGLKAQTEKGAAEGTPASLETKLVMGSPYAEIINEARQGQYDLIVIATNGRSGWSRLMVGSVAERVVRAAPCPVLTVRAPSDAESEERAAG